LANYGFQLGRALPLPALTPAQRDADEDLYAGLLGLAGIVVDDLTVDELLTQVAEFAVYAIPGADGAGVTLTHPSEARSRIRRVGSDGGVRP
jgi:hypothetical protein